MPTIVFTDGNGEEVARMKDRSAGGLSKQINEIADTHNRAPKWAEDQGKALEAGKSSDQPAALIFLDESPQSETAEKFLGEQALAELYPKFSWSRTRLTVKSEEAKKLGLTRLPALWIVDPRVEDPFAKPLKKISLPKAGKDLKSELSGVLKSWKPAEKKEGEGEKKGDEGAEGEK